MITLTKMAVLGVVLVLAGCHIDGTMETGHDENGNRLTAEGKPCITPMDVNVGAQGVSGMAENILLEKLGFDKGVDGLDVYTTYHDGDGPTIGVQVTDKSNCLLFLGEVSRSELARMLGIKTFGGIDQQ